MKRVVLKANAVPVYRLLSHVRHHLPAPSETAAIRVLDCGAGGELPPLSLFQQHGFEAWGLDLSRIQLSRSAVFCRQDGINLRLQQGDMRRIPFANDSFDVVYEHYSMCHMNREDTILAIREMKRVLKPGGVSFLGFISRDTWPLSMFGSERQHGEFRGEEGGEDTLHSIFTDREAEALVADWEIEWCEKQVRFLRDQAEGLHPEAWPALVAANPDSPLGLEYQDRIHLFKYVHIYYIVRK